MNRSNSLPRDERGQVGIGTLIVFIAMVLVAAIAAGVLINTSGFLQSSAEATGQDASDQTTNRIQVVSATGTHLSGGEIGVVNLIVKPGPGAGNIDLGEATVQWVGPSGSYYQLAEDGASGNPDGYFQIATVTDEDNSSPVLNDGEDRLKIQLDLGSLDVADTESDTFGSELREGEIATIRITAGSGASTRRQVVAPETISGTSAVRM